MGCEVQEATTTYEPSLRLWPLSSLIRAPDAGPPGSSLAYSGSLMLPPVPSSAAHVSCISTGRDTHLSLDPGTNRPGPRPRAGCLDEHCRRSVVRGPTTVPSPNPRTFYLASFERGPGTPPGPRTYFTPALQAPRARKLGSWTPPATETLKTNWECLCLVPLF